MDPSWRKKVDRKLAELAAARTIVRNEIAANALLDERLAAVIEAQGLAQQVAQQVQNLAHAQISQIVTRCLEAVFDNPYRFEIKFERKRGRTEARLIFERGGLEVDPLTASGGGVVDVAAFALRVACLVLSRPALRRVLILDEPFRFVSADLRGRVRQLLEALTREMSVQIVMVTHDPQLRAGTLVDLGT